MPYTDEQKREHIAELQRYLYSISLFNSHIPQITPTGIYDHDTAEAVRKFQQIYGLPVNGETDRDTWNMIVRVYLDYLNSEPAAYHAFPSRDYIVRDGDTGQVVYVIQAMLNDLGNKYDNSPAPDVCGDFNLTTADAVKAFQQKVGLPENGCVDSGTWNMLVHCCEHINNTRLK